MIAIASRSISNNKPISGNNSTNYYSIKQKTPEEKAAREEADRKYYAEQTALLNQCQEKASLNPPEYPIKIRFNNNYFETILRNNEGCVFASSFNDAVKKVQQEIGSMESVLMDQFKNSRYYKNGDVLRLSSANKSMFRNVNLSLPEGRFFIYSVSKPIPISCWSIIVSSAAPTMMSSMRIASQNRYNTGGKSRAKKSTFKKSTFKKGRAKKSRKSRRKKGTLFKG